MASRYSAHGHEAEFEPRSRRRVLRNLQGIRSAQAGLPVLDFGGIRGDEKRRYIAAVHAGLEQNYAPMTRIFRRVIERTLRSQAND